MKSKISFIGSGNVAWNLAHALDLAGNDIVQVISRDVSHAKELASKYGAYYGNDFSKMYNDADFVIITVSDDAYEDVIDMMGRGMKGIVCHTSGATSLDVFEESGLKCGVFYPLQSFTKGKTVDFLNVPILIESKEPAVEKALYQLADQVSNKVKTVSSEQRAVYHLAAVFANNFSNYMYVLAERILDEKDLDFKMLHPLINETALRLKNDKAKNLQTGPARRGDKDVINRHLEMIEDEKIKLIYQLLSEGIMTLH